MPGPNNEACERCYYWERIPVRCMLDGYGKQDHGTCYRNPKVEVKLDLGWCGEFREKNNDQTPDTR